MRNATGFSTVADRDQLYYLTAPLKYGYSEFFSIDQSSPPGRIYFDNNYDAGQRFLLVGGGYISRPE